ncbi:MAG: hypothetical protein WC025_00390 [Candidatus Magasanikbacteria bacterium]
MQKQFLVGRYYFDTLFRDEANKSFISDLTKKPTFEEGNIGYALANTSFEKVGESKESFLRGTFAKFKIKDYYKKYLKKENGFQESITDNKVESQIEFFLHHPSHLIFIEKSSQIRENIFKNKFIKIYEKNTSVTKPNMGLDFLFDEKDVYEEIKSWDRIVKAKFNDLRPSNPRMDPHFEKIEELLKETKSDRSKLEFKIDDPDSTNSLDSESVLIKQALALSSYGYGNANFDGFKGKNTTNIKTKKFVKSVKLDFDSETPFSVVIDFIEKDEKGEM